ncbi:hypothetical protein QCA50_003319 [Cerrena zonata]|uniref:Zn(2)-C6 fungal-type domain-containing protein n=1 Tax=Cerrena zonata TaxID=2478898 RepID=A0AAW0GUP6_9APHY
MSSNPSNPNPTDSISSDGKGGPPSSQSGQTQTRDAESTPQPKKARKATSTRKQSKKQTQGPATLRPDPSPPPEDHSSRLSNVRDQPQQQSPPQPRFTAHLQQPLLPGPPAYPILTTGYPMTGHPHPYGTPSPYAHPGTPVNGQATHAAIPQYPYAVHHAAYSQYPPYPQYSPAAQLANGKGNSTDDTGPSGSQNTSPTTAQEPKKRTKTQRACDSCRSRKIRCDILSETDPPKCQHCNQYGFECTFFLPISETRFKKKKLEEEAAAAADKDNDRSTHSPHVEQSKNGEVKVYGPTSAAFLLHSAAMISSRTYETYDMRYHHTWDVSANGDGIIQVNEPQKGELQLSLPKPNDLRIEREVVEKLLNAYFTDVAPLLPVVKQAEFLATNPPPAVLLYSMCLVAATRRDVPQAVFDSIRYAVNSLIKAEDVLSTASTVNVQTLMILSMSGDCHSQSVPNALSALWIRLGAGIRMAQDLGLHRAEAVKQNIELRRRLWGICVIHDRWVSVTYGHPHMIDVQDCDARLPSSGDPQDLYLDELVRLSVILGRVQKAIYTPAGLNVTNDEALYTLLNNLETWKKNLPDDLQFRGPESPRNAGILFIFYAAVNMLFWRVFMRISYSCPAHLKFCLTVEKWTELVQMTGDAIDWLDANDRIYDIWLLIAYCATSCALVQYHTWARRRDPEAQAKLKKLRDCVRKWEGALSPDHMSARRKTAEIIALLYEATQGPQQPVEPPVLNPTGGVKGKPATGSLVFTKDPSRPGGGVFVARERPSDDLVRELPEGTIISATGETITAAVSNVRTPNDDVSMSLPADASSSSSPAAYGGNNWTWSSTSGHAHGGSATASPQQQHQQHQHQQQQQQQASSSSTSMVNLTPIGGNGSGGNNYQNMNPALNTAVSGGPENVQILNMLDYAPQGNPVQTLQVTDQVTDPGFFTSIPASMYDYNQWESFFSRFGTNLTQFPSQQNQQQQTAQQAPAQYSHQQYSRPSGGTSGGGMGSGI